MEKKRYVVLVTASVDSFSLPLAGIEVEAGSSEEAEQLVRDTPVVRQAMRHFATLRLEVRLLP